MRKKICMIGIAVIMSLGLVACGGKETDTPDANDEAKTESPVEPADEADNKDEDNKDEVSEDNNDEAGETDAAENPSGEWTLEGAFIDDSENHLLIYHMKVEDGYDEEGWSLTAIFGEDIYGGEVEVKGGVMAGKIATYDDNGDKDEEIEVTLKEEDGQIIFKSSDGREYKFKQDDTDYSEANDDLMPFFQYNQIYGDDPDPVEAAAYDYLAFEKEKDADPSYALIPYVNVIAVDDSNEKDVLIYGDYFIMELKKDGDTLVEVSGSHCPGVIHAERFGEGEMAIYSANSMDEGFTDDDVKTLFGKHFKEYTKATSDYEKVDKEKAQIIADYVKANNLEITKYELTGEEAKDLPEAK